MHTFAKQPFFSLLTCGEIEVRSSRVVTTRLFAYSIQNVLFHTVLIIFSHVFFFFLFSVRSRYSPVKSSLTYCIMRNYVTCMHGRYACENITVSILEGIYHNRIYHIKEPGIYSWSTYIHNFEHENVELGYVNVIRWRVYEWICFICG